MGIDLVTWRSKIGTFNGCGIFKNKDIANKYRSLTLPLG